MHCWFIRTNSQEGITGINSKQKMPQSVPTEADYQTFQPD